MTSVDLESFIKAVIHSLEKSKIKYVLVGGIAAIIYGRPRSTLDIDIVIDSSNNEEIKRLEDVLKSDGFSIQENEILEAVKEESHCSIFLEDYIYRIDIQGVYSSLNSRCLNNRLQTMIYGFEVYIQRAEDLVIAKLIYGSPQDLEDIQAILIRKKQDLDYAYLMAAARGEQVENELQQILDQLKRNQRDLFL